MKRVTDRYEFSDLGALRNWLNAFHETDLSTVHFECLDGDEATSLAIQWIEESLSDGSKVHNARINLTWR